MRSLAPLAGALVFALSAHASPKSVFPAHRASVAAPHLGKCVAAKGMLARAAYVPAAGPNQCAQLLSTGTILSPHAWNKT